MAQTLARVAVEIYRKPAASPPPGKPKAVIVHAVHEHSPGRAGSPALTDRRRLRKRSPLRVNDATSENPYPKYTPMLVQSSTRDSNDSLPNSRLGSEESRPPSRLRPRQLWFNHDIHRESQHSAAGLTKGSHNFRIHGIPSYVRRTGVVRRIHGRSESQQAESRQISKALYSKIVSDAGKTTGEKLVVKRAERKILKSEVFFQPPKVTVKKRSDSCHRHRSPSKKEEFV